MANYPGSAPSFTVKSAGQTIQPSHVNDVQDEVTAIGGGLLNGTARLNSSHSTVVSLSAATSTITNLSGTNSTITNMTAGSVITTAIQATNSTMSNINAGSMSITSITATGSTISNVNVGTLTLGTIECNSTNLTINVSSTTTASSGALTLPAGPVGYLKFTVNGTDRRIPFYAA